MKYNREGYARHHYDRNYQAGFFVYKIINRVNGLQYIGCTTKSLQKRWEEHRSSSHQTQRSWRPMYQDILKYGVENFSIELIIECASKFEMRRQETQHIWQQNTIWPNGYNLHPGRIRDIAIPYS